jgi:16S rRNA processing protein RimM
LSSSGSRESDLPPEEDLIALGRITRTQGHRGDVRLFPFFEPLSRFEGLRSNEVFARPEPHGGLKKPGATPFRPLHIFSYFFHQQYVILSFDEVSDMNAAEELRGTVLYARQADLWPLAEDEFLAHDMAGLRLLDDATGDDLGMVEAIDPGAAHDFLKVRRGERTFLVPFVRNMVKRVDLDAREIRVTLPPGLDEV